MARKPSNLSTDIRGASQLTIDAIIGITDLTESLHSAIANRASFLDAPQNKRTRGITGMVYWNVRTVTSLVGGGIDTLLGQLSGVVEEKEPSAEREAVRSALNGVLGDHLAANNNPLAIPMQLHRNGSPLTDQSLAEAIHLSNGKLVILIHGSCMNDLQWNREGHDHGAALARDLGVAPLYLHYNTGRHISENGRDLANLLQSVSQRASQTLELTLIAHSMGGLVARSACHEASLSGQSWLNQLQKILFLGTPHHGAPLEKGGNWIDILLDASPYSAPFARLGKIRSAGLTDLRYGTLVEEDWHGRDRFRLGSLPRTPVPLPQGVACYAIAATTRSAPTKLGDHLIGDGLVPVDSALGRHPNPMLDLGLPETHQWLGRDMHHINLLNHPTVYATIKNWLKTA